MTATVRQSQSSGNAGSLYLALELSERRWKLAFSSGMAQKPRLRTIAARDVKGLSAEIAAAKQRFRLPSDASVVSCYEAGRDGFWIHRWLTQQGVNNHVVDSSSIEVPRRKRRAKTDRIDAEKLLALLLRASQGERYVWREVCVPSPEAEDARHRTRELEAWKGERKRLTNRITSILVTQGISGPLTRSFGDRIALLQRADSGERLGEQLQARLRHEWEHLEFVRAKIRRLERERSAYISQAHKDRSREVILHLMRLAGIAETGATTLALEMFGWRKFKNRSNVGGFLGITGTPFDSGDTHRDQGISKAGNARLRHLMVQLAWLWLRCQPASELSQWYQRRFAATPKERRIGIVALARKLTIALWRYVEWGELPEGAVLKPLPASA